MRLSDEMRISCRPSCWGPHKLTLSLLGHEEPRARTERRPALACRLHAQVRPRVQRILALMALARLRIDLGDMSRRLRPIHGRRHILVTQG